jgi:demethylmenaquinone methyltransferase/2-methoxy-6-polyprenyl-1,4-benzoquinol methylase
MTASDDAIALAPHAPLPAYYGRAQDKTGFVRALFDRTARDYDRVERVMALGTGSWYRRQALRRAGLDGGMTVLDVAAGTGMVSREALAITQSPTRVIALDPSRGMLDELKARLPIRALQARGENLPLADGSFDFLSMGYALRHLRDLRPALSEFFRVLRPGGRVCLLEITAPPGRAARLLLRAYFQGFVPCLARLTARQADSPLLWRYYWDTIAACLPPERVLAAMRDSGFCDVRRHVELGIFSEYTGRRP